MGHPKPPVGYVDLTAAAEITGYAQETIRLAAQTGDLKAIQRVKGSPWFFKPSDLRTWRGIEEPVAS